MNSTYIAILQLLDNLPEETYEEIYNLILTSVNLTGKSTTPVPDPVVCVSCGSRRVVRNGRSRCGHQTYLCRTCGKSFTETTGSAIQYTHQPKNSWDKVIRDTFNGVSLNDTANAIKVSFPTALSMRHKVMHCIEDEIIKNNDILAGYNEADETYFRESFKGTKLGPGAARAPRKRGSKSSKRGLSSDKICVCASVGPGNMSYAMAVNRANPSGADIVKVFAHKVSQSTTIICDDKPCYNALNPYCTVARANRVNKVNSLHNFMKFRINKLAHGVATKYLNRYNAVLSSAYANNAATGIQKACSSIRRRDFRFVTIRDLRHRFLTRV